MKTRIKSYSKHLLILLVLFTGLSGFQLLPNNFLSFSIIVDQQDAQYITDLAITIEFVDGSQITDKIDQSDSIWSKTYHQQIKRIHLKAYRYTGQLFDPAKLLIDSYLEPIGNRTGFTLTLGGTYQRPYIGRRFQSKRQLKNSKV